MTSDDPIEKSFILRSFKKLCPPELYEGIEGDLIERFEEDSNTFGSQKATTKFIFHTLKFFKPDIILRNKFSIQLITPIFLTNSFISPLTNIINNNPFRPFS